MMIIFHFYFLLLFIFACKKVADKNYHRPKGIKNPHESKHSKNVSIPHGLNILYEVVRVQYLKICTTKQTYRQTSFFERWRAYLKRWSVISSLPLSKSERTAYCRRNSYDNKTLNKPFCFPLHKTTSGKRKKLSYKRAKTHTYKACRCLQAKQRGKIPLIIYTHTKHNLNICLCL